MKTSSSVTVFIPSPLRRHCLGSAHLSLEARTVRQALDELAARFGSLYSNICDETGSVRRHINLFVNSAHTRDLAGLDTKLAPGDVLIVLPAVSGG